MPSGWVLLAVGSIAAGVLAGMAASGAETGGASQPRGGPGADAPAQDLPEPPVPPGGDPATGTVAEGGGKAGIEEANAEPANLEQNDAEPADAHQSNPEQADVGPAVDGRRPGTAGTPGDHGGRSGTVLRRTGWAPLIVTGILAAVAAAVAAGPSIASRIWPPTCPQPVELRVLTSPDQLAAVSSVARVYERATVDERRCKAANLYVYAPPTAEVAEVLGRGWTNDDFRRWPRPDVWLVDSSVAVDDVRSGSGATPQYEVELADLAFTPVVLGLPADATPDWAARTATWSQVLRAAQEDGWGFVRSNRHASASGVHALAAVLADFRVPSEVTHPEVNLLERQIARTMGRGAYRVDDEAGDEVLLRQLSEAPEAGSAGASPTAVVVTEQSLVMHQRLSAGLCPPQPRLRAYYPGDTIPVVLRFALLRWHDAAGSPQTDMAEQLRRWLLEERGQQALTEVGLRPVDGPPDGLVAPGCGADPRQLPDGLTQDNHPDQKLAELRWASEYPPPLPGRLLFLLDTSGSMTDVVERGADGEPDRSRFTVAAEAVRGALRHMTNSDAFGLWGFPGGSDEVAELVPLRPAPGADDPDYLDRLGEEVELVLRRTAAEGRTTPLFAAIREGFDALALDDGGEVSSAVVVISDGEDTGDGPAASELVDTVADGGVRIFVLMVGGSRCDPDLAEVTAVTGGDCRETNLATLTSALDRLVRAVWGGADGD